MGLRVGVVGAGAAGRLHALGYLSAGSRARLVAIADVDFERAGRCVGDSALKTRWSITSSCSDGLTSTS